MKASELLEWPAGIVRLGVGLCVGLACLVVLVELPRAVDRLHDRAASNAALTFEDREFGAALGVVADQRALREARALIPPGGTFNVVVGSGPIAGETELTRPFIESFATSLLLPRRHSDSSPWVLCYGCDIGALGAGAKVIWSNGGGISIVRRSV